jgi:ankyrin repeat protein
MRTRTRRILVATLILIAAAFAAVLRANGRDLRVLEAVKRRDQKAFAALIRSKADINAAQADGATALAWAAHLGQREMAEALLRAGARVNTSDDYGETPLTLACANGDGEMVQRLLAAGAKADAMRWDGETAVMLAAGAGSLQAIRALVRRGAEVNLAEPERGQTALMWAAAEGHSDVVSGLVEIGADIKAVSKGGFTALVFAVIADDARSIKTLLAAGADPNDTLPSGSTSLIVALSYDHTAAAMALLDGGALTGATDGRTGYTALHVAAQQGDLTIVKALLARGVDSNVRTPKAAPGGARGGGGGARAAGAGEQTPLMLAAKGDHEDVMRTLIAAGADPSLRAQDGSTLLMVAAGGARLATFKYAYELDPHVDSVASSNGSTVMHAAANLGNRSQTEVCEVIQFLADHGAALDELDAAGRTPLVVADRLPVDLAVDLLIKLITDRGGKPKIASQR